MKDILETIDQALDDYDTSDDAMRWSPDPVAAGVAPYPRCSELVDRICEITGLELTSWQRGWLEAVLEGPPSTELVDARHAPPAQHGPAFGRVYLDEWSAI